MNIKRSEIKNIREKIKQIYKEALVSYQDGVYYGGDYADVISPRLASILKFASDYVEETFLGYKFVIKLSKNYKKSYENYANLKTSKTFDRIEIEDNVITVYAQRYSKNVLNNLIDIFDCRNEIAFNKKKEETLINYKNTVYDVIKKLSDIKDNGKKELLTRALYDYQLLLTNTYNNFNFEKRINLYKKFLESEG